MELNDVFLKQLYKAIQDKLIKSCCALCGRKGIDCGHTTYIKCKNSKSRVCPHRINTRIFCANDK